MSNSESTLEPVIKFLGEKPGVLGLTGRKISARAEMVHSSEWPGWVVFEMERHPVALGNREEERGSSVIIRSRYRYAYHPERRELKEIATVGNPVLECDIDTLALSEIGGLEFFCNLTETGRIVCEEVVNNESSEVWSADQARDFGRSIPASWEFDWLFLEGYGLDISGQIMKLIESLQSCERRSNSGTGAGLKPVRFWLV